MRMKLMFVAFLIGTLFGIGNLDSAKAIEPVGAVAQVEGHLSGFHCHTTLLGNRVGGYTKCYNVSGIKWRLNVKCYANSRMTDTPITVWTYWIGHNGEISKLCPSSDPWAYSTWVSWYRYARVKNVIGTNHNKQRKTNVTRQRRHRPASTGSRGSYRRATRRSHC